MEINLPSYGADSPPTVSQTPVHKLSALWTFPSAKFHLGFSFYLGLHLQMSLMLVRQATLNLVQCPSAVEWKVGKLCLVPFKQASRSSFGLLIAYLLSSPVLSVQFLKQFKLIDEWRSCSRGHIESSINPVKRGEKEKEKRDVQLQNCLISLDSCERSLEGYGK